MATALAKKGKSIKIIRHVYLYLVAMIGLITFVMGSVSIINTGLQRYVFQVDQLEVSYAPVYPGSYDQCSASYPSPKNPTDKNLVAPTDKQISDCRKAQEEERKRSNEAQFGRQISLALAQIAIGLPIWLFHWRVIQQDNRKKEND